MRSSTPPQHEDISFTVEVTNKTEAAKQDMSTIGSRKKCS